MEEEVTEVNMQSLHAIVRCMGPISKDWKENHRVNKEKEKDVSGQFDEFMRIVTTNETAKLMFLPRETLKEKLLIMATTGKADISDAKSRYV